MDFSHFIEQINSRQGFSCFEQADETEINYLLDLKLPDDIFDFYSKHSPVDLIEINNIRLLAISGIIEENTNYTPGYLLSPLGFCVIASTIEGDVYCIHTSTNGYSIVIASHDEIHKGQTEEEILQGTKKITETFTNFLSAFIQGKLVTSFYDLEEL